MSQLRELKLSNISMDITSLAGLVHLKKLTLVGDLIFHAEVLKNLGQLQELNVVSNLSDIDFLATLDQLRILTLSDTSLSNIDALAKLSQLKILNLSNKRRS